MPLDSELHAKLRAAYAGADAGLDRAALVEDVLRVFYSEAKFGVAEHVDREALMPVLDAATDQRTKMRANPFSAHHGAHYGTTPLTATHTVDDDGNLR